MRIPLAQPQNLRDTIAETQTYVEKLFCHGIGAKARCDQAQTKKAARGKTTDGRCLVLPRAQPMSLAMATAVSFMRLEKPHSLSYQDTTRTSLSSTIWVWVASKQDEWALWLKSMETSGSVT